MLTGGGALLKGIEIDDKIPLTEEELKGMFVDIMPRIC